MKCDFLPSIAVRESDHTPSFPKEDKLCDLHLKVVTGIRVRAVSNRVSKAIRNCFGFTNFTMLHDWFKKLALPWREFFKPIRPKTNHNLVTRVFPRLAPVTCICFEFSLVHFLLFTFVVIGHCNCFAFGFTTLY